MMRSRQQFNETVCSCKMAHNRLMVGATCVCCCLAVVRSCRALLALPSPAAHALAAAGAQDSQEGRLSAHSSNHSLPHSNAAAACMQGAGVEAVQSKAVLHRRDSSSAAGPAHPPAPALTHHVRLLQGLQLPAWLFREPGLTGPALL